MVQVRVVPNHSDWTYELGEKANFTVHVIADQHPLEDIMVTYRVGQEMMPADGHTAVVPPEGLVIDGGTMTEPGFIRFVVNTNVNGRSYRDLVA